MTHARQPFDVTQKSHNITAAILNLQSKETEGILNIIRSQKPIEGRHGNHIKIAKETYPLKYLQMPNIITLTLRQLSLFTQQRNECHIVKTMPMR